MMNIVPTILYTLSKKERIALMLALILFFTASVAKAVVVVREHSTFTPVAGGSYREGVVGQPHALNPIISGNTIDQDISALIYGRLGTLASVIEVEEDGRVYVVKLHEGLVWDDGKPLTSDDIVFTVKTIQNPEVRSPLYKNWRGIIVERVSELQVRFSLPSPYVFFMENIVKLSPIPQHIFGIIPASNMRLSSYNFEPVGSGPYRFKTFTKKRDGFITEYRFTANKRFAGEPPFIQDFQFKFYENENDLFRAFKMRDIDGFGILSLVNEAVYKLPRAIIAKIPMPRYYAVFFNPKATSILKEQTFREALTLAIDKNMLVQKVLRGEGIAINGPFYNDKKDIYIGPDKERAAAMIEEMKDGAEALVIKLIVPNVTFVERVAEFVEQEWKSVGIDEVEIVALGTDDFFNAVLRERNYEAVVFGNILEHPLDLFPFWHSSERFYPGLNLSFYADDKVDTALENIRQAEDEAERRQEFENAAERIQESAPAAFLFSLPYVYVYNERLYGTDFENTLVVPSDRFQNIGSWYVTRARILTPN